MRSPTARRATARHIAASSLVVLSLSAWTLAVPSIAVAQPPGGSNRTTNHAYNAYVSEAAQRFGIPEGWIRAVMRAESGGEPRAVSKAGAMGLMQLMPSTWADLAARYRLGTDPFDPRANILAGTAYLRAMLDRYRDPASALAAYNAGPGRVDARRTTGQPLPAETIAYVARLAPQLSGSSIGVASTPPPVAVDWRASGLFSAPISALVVRSANAANNADDGQQPTERRTHPMPAERPTHASRPSSGALFVVLSGDGS